MHRTSRLLICGVCLFGLAVVAPAGAKKGPPMAISPGSADGFTAVAAACPTFSWSAVEGAAGYELVVYEASPRRTAGARPRPGDMPVLRRTIPGRGLSWTPPADDCLSLEGAYAWSVRPLSAAGPGEWSEAALFRIAPLLAVSELAPVLERALIRYLESQGLRAAPSGRLAQLISEELAGAGPDAAPAPAQPPRRLVYSGGRRHILDEGEPLPRGVFGDDVELFLSESGSSASDKVQLVFATPEFDGDPAFGDAWAIIVDASASAPETGTMFFSTPSFFDALQLFTDGSAIVGEQREMKLRPSSSPPATCSALQEGMLYWDSDIGALCVCDGSSWDPADSDNMGSCS